MTKFMVSLYKTPQAQDDYDEAFEDTLSYLSIADLLSNDLGGTATEFYGLYDPLDPTAASQSAKTALGAQLTVNADGTISYDATAAYESILQSLSAGETAEDPFEYIIRLSDGTLSKATVYVTVTGENDLAVITGTDAGNVIEDADGSDADTASDAFQTASGQLDFTDSDTKDVRNALHTVRVLDAPAGTLGNLTATLTADTVTGAGGVIDWTYSVDNSLIQSLGQNESKVETFTLELFDGHSTVTKTVSVTINGWNDRPDVHVQLDAQGAKINEAFVFAQNGNPILVGDPDASETLTVTLSVQKGTLALGDLTGLALTVAGSGTGSLTLQGSAADLNAALAGLSYTGTTAGADQLKIEATDAGGLSDTATVDLTVTSSLNVVQGTTASYEWLLGTSGADLITGGGGWDYYFGYGGNDILDARPDGGGYFDGGTGLDELYAGSLGYAYNAFLLGDVSVGDVVVGSEATGTWDYLYAGYSGTSGLGPVGHDYVVEGVPGEGLTISGAQVSGVEAVYAVGNGDSDFTATGDFTGSGARNIGFYEWAAGNNTVDLSGASGASFHAHTGYGTDAITGSSGNDGLGLYASSGDVVDGGDGSDRANIVQTGAPVLAGSAGFSVNGVALTDIEHVSVHASSWLGLPAGDLLNISGDIASSGLALGRSVQAVGYNPLGQGVTIDASEITDGRYGASIHAIGNGDQSITGGAGSDLIQVNQNRWWGSTSDPNPTSIVNAGDGNDVVYAETALSAARSFIDSGAGNDTFIDVGYVEGYARLYSQNGYQSGVDTFVFKQGSGRDTITTDYYYYDRGFTAGEGVVDVLDVSDYGFTSMQQVKDAISSDASGRAVLNLDASNSVTFNHWTATDLRAALVADDLILAALV